MKDNKVYGVEFKKDDYLELCRAGVQMQVFFRSDIHFIKDNNLSYSEIIRYRDHIFDLETEEISYEKIKIKKEKYRKHFLERKNAC